MIKGHCLNSQCLNSDDGNDVEFFFKCHNSNHESTEKEVPPLYQIRSNIHDISCLGMVSREMAIITIFGHKHFKPKFHQ